MAAVHLCYEKDVEATRALILQLQADGGKVAATHSGAFHTDEVTAEVLMFWLLGQKFSVVRSRVASIIDQCDLVMDVGGTYDGVKRFDHHQKTFEDTFPWTVAPVECGTTKMSSAGLIWLHFGKDILKKVFAVPDDAVEEMHQVTYQMIFHHIDAIDNGVSQCKCPRKLPKGVSFLPGLNGGVSMKNPGWTSTDPEFETAGFKQAMEFVSQELRDELEIIVTGYPLAKKAFAAAAAAAAGAAGAAGAGATAAAGAQFIMLDSQKPFTPWLQFLSNIPGCRVEDGLLGAVVDFAEAADLTAASVDGDSLNNKFAVYLATVNCYDLNLRVASEVVEEAWEQMESKDLYSRTNRWFRFPSAAERKVFVERIVELQRKHEAIPKTN